jgi:hypothetical protein
MAETFASSSGVGVGGAAGYMQGLVNSAVGKITIDTSGAQQAVPAMQGVAQGINQAMNQVGAGSNQAAAGISQVAGAVRGLAGAFGISFGVQGVVQLVKMAISASETATAFRRQEVAARSLAGSQQQLNYLLAAYEKASGGAIDKATELANVTDLLAQGFAGTAEQVTQFVEGVRGASIAMGKSQEYIQQYVQLAIANQSTKRLNEIGLGIAEVENRITSLRSANAGMTQGAAFQAAVLGLLNEKYGALAKSTEGQKTGMEKAAASGKNLALTFGEIVGPTLNAVGEDFNRTLTRWNDGLTAFTELAKMAANAVQGIHPATAGVPAWMTGVSKAASGPLGEDHSQEIRATKLDWAKGIQDLNNNTNEQLLQQNQDYQRQRSDSERSYQESTLRAAEDFALTRQREEQDMVDSISRIHRDSAHREEREAADLARGIGQAEADSAERVAKDKKDATDRLAELDTSYEKARVKRAKDLNDKLMDAAGNLDAKQVYELQRDAARQEEEAKSAHDDQRDKLQKQLQERLDDESKSLDKSIRQQKDAYNRQLEDGRAADAQRITDMQTDFDKRKTQEDTDYGIRLTRAQTDHNDQLTEMERAQGLRITQIQTHAAQERTQLDTEHESALIKLGVHNQDWIDAETKLNNAALKLLEPLLTAGRSLILFPGAGSNTVPFPSMVGANAPPPYSGASNSGYSNSSRSVTIGNVTVSVAGTTNMSQSQFEDAVHNALVKTIEDLN